MDTKALRQKILDLAIRGKLVPQDPNDEPASVLLERIRAEKERLIAEGKIKRHKKSKASSSESHYQKLPKGWSECKIEDVVKTLTDFVASGSFASLRENVQYYDSPNYAILVRTKDLGSNFMGGLVYTDKHGYDFLSNSNLYGGELILPNIGASIGKVFLMPKIEVPTTLAPNSIMIRCWEEYTLKWLYLLFQSTLGQNILASISASTAQGKFNKTDLREVIIPLPPLYEQERILTQADCLLEYVEKINKDKTDLITILNSTKSKILELAMQGKLVPQDPNDEPAADMLRRINPKARIITDNPHYPQLPDNWVLTTIESVSNYGKCISVSVEDIKDDEWILELEDIEKDSGRVIEKKKKSCRNINGVRHKFNEGEVLYSKLRTYLNKVLLAKEVGYCTTEIIPISCNDSILPQYLCHWLRSPYFLNYTFSCGYGVKMPRLSTSDAKNGLIPLPPINEQRQIISKLEILFSLLDNLSNHLS